METEPFLNRRLAAAVITLGFATSIALAVRDMKNTDQQTPSVWLRLLVVKSIQESTAGATIMFQTGEKGRLSRHHKEYQYQITLAQRSEERAHPVGVRIDSAGEIGEMARADSDYVITVTEKNYDKVRVVFRMHNGIAYLERQHPRFENIRRDLIRSWKEKKRIWFVWRLPRLMLEDVMIVEEHVKATKLTELVALPAEFRSAAEAAAKYLKEKGEEPSEFYVGDISRTGKTIVLPLWHISAFPLRQRTLGNPGGKCRNLEYDTVTGRITAEVFWQ